MTEQTHQLHLKDGKTSIPFPETSKKTGWKVASRKRDPEEPGVIILTIEHKETGERLARRVNIGDLRKKKPRFSMGNECVHVEVDEIETHPAEGDLDFGEIERIKPDTPEISEPEEESSAEDGTSEAQEQIPEEAEESELVENPEETEEAQETAPEAMEVEALAPPEPEPPVVTPEVLPPAEQPSRGNGAPTVATVGANSQVVNLHIHPARDPEVTDVTEAPTPPEPGADEVAQPAPADEAAPIPPTPELPPPSPAVAPAETPAPSAPASSEEPTPREPPPEVVALPIRSTQPPSTKGPVTNLPRKTVPVKQAATTTMPPTGPLPAGAPGSVTEQRNQFRAKRKLQATLAEELLRYKKRKQEDRDKARASRVARKLEKLRAKEAKRAEREANPIPRRSGQSPLVLIGLGLVALALIGLLIWGGILVAGSIGNESGHTASAASDSNNEEGDEANLPVNAPTEDGPKHIWIILPDTKEWSKDVNTGDELMRDYVFKCSEPGVHLKTGNGDESLVETEDRPPSSGPFWFKDPKGRSDIKCSVSW